MSSRDAVLKRNERLRQVDGTKRLDWGRLEFDIPLADLPVLDQFFPGIKDPSHPDHRWQLKRFRNSPISAVYRVTAERSKTNAGHIWTGQ